MERCPNCGAPARPGAKFCTTCGYRLPAAVAAPTEPVETSTTGASSWPAPPASKQESEADASDEPAATVTESAPASTVDVVIPGPDPENEPIDDAEAARTIGSGDPTAVNTDEVLSSSWPSTSSSSQPSPWTASGAGTDVGGTVAGDRAEPESTDAGIGSGVSEETVIVTEPASQYEGWSAAVVEEVAPPSESTGTNIARATALLDELRLLLPVLATSSTGGTNIGESITGDLESALASAKTATEDRQALRGALNEARDNPRDIQTILALSAQVDAAIALLDEHERLIATVEQAVGNDTPSSGIYPSSE